MAKTLKNVADAAGVSAATASIVLNGRAEGRISDEVANRVLAIAKDLNYRPNLTARSLRTQESKTIGLISDQIATTPFAGQMLAGAQDVAWRNGWLLLLVNTEGNNEFEETATKSLIQRNVDGFIYASMYHREVSIPKSMEEQLVILLDCFDKNSEYDSVVPAEYLGARKAIDFLVSKGHKRIAHITDGNNDYASPQRLRAFLDVLNEKQIQIDEKLILKTPGSDTHEGYIATKKLLVLGNRPTAIFAYNDRMAFGAYEAIQEAGLEVGKDISVIGFDNQPYFAAALRPALTTVQLPHYEMGAWAAQRLLEQFKNSEPTDSIQNQIDCALIVRDSVGSAR